MNDMYKLFIQLLQIILMYLDAHTGLARVVSPILEHRISTLAAYTGWYQ